MTKKKQQRYTPEFRAEAVKLVTEQGLTLEAGAARLAIPAGTLANWVATAKRATVGAVPGSRSAADLQAEIARLRRELLEMLSSVLMTKGFEVIKASNGYEALKALDGSHIDLVITDLVMPGMGGFELTRHIRGMEGYKTVPILMLTAQSDERAKREGKEAGVTGWVVKPVSPEKLHAAVRRACPEL